MVKRAMKQEGGDAGPEEEVRKEEKDATTPGASSEGEGSEASPQEKKAGGGIAKKMTMRHKRAKGGMIPGKAAKSNVGRRARGGSADTNPYTAAGNMSEPSYQRAQPGPDEGGKGGDSAGLSGRS